ncbi:MAG: multicopper oxidase domain-containing protein [Rhodothermales bacterium]|nr:multicopper oxidase domain-containing protein [Rhodothermales bacterium]
MKTYAFVILLMLGSVLSGVLAFSGNDHEPGRTRTYYIAAEEVDWDYAPSGRNLMMDAPLDSTVFRVRNGPPVLARQFRKVVYREYADSTFAMPKPRPAAWQHLGLLGPVLRAEVGDTLVVYFKNTGRYAYSMHPHGVFYDKDSEGAPYADGTAAGSYDKHDDAVPPGDVHRYVWPVPERAGPGPADPSSIVWPYHSHANELEDVHSGLMGPILVTRRGAADDAGRPLDVDREFVTLFGVFNENTTRYVADNLMRHTGDSLRVNAAGEAKGFFGLGLPTINGYLYGNLPLAALRMNQGERVRWYLFSSTGFNDFHTPHWHGGTVLVDGRRRDVIDLGGPLLMETADMLADNPGIWMLHCHFAEHMMEGMAARFEIVPGAETAAAAGR